MQTYKLLARNNKYRGTLTLETTFNPNTNKWMYWTNQANAIKHTSCKHVVQYIAESIRNDSNTRIIEFDSIKEI